ncbi:MAG: hydantoinase/oxoprolinase family protein, partial [Alphaproteobacteria bacterium]
DFALVSFGGGGPLHGAAIMREVGISQMLVPPEPGVLCAMGCCIADIRNDVSQTMERGLNNLAQAELDTALDNLRIEGEARLAASDVELLDPKVTFAADMCYLGQIHNLRVPIESGWSVDDLKQAFEDAYRAEFGNTLGAIPIIVVSLLGTASATPPVRPTRAPQALVDQPAKPYRRRPVYFGGWAEADIYQRAGLTPGMHFSGPAIVEQSDATTVIEPAMRARVDGFGNLLVEAE